MKWYTWLDLGLLSAGVALLAWIVSTIPAGIQQDHLWGGPLGIQIDNVDVFASEIFVQTDFIYAGETAVAWFAVVLVVVGVSNIATDGGLRRFLEGRFTRGDAE